MNEELHDLGRQQAQLAGDLVNLLSSVDIPIMVLDGEQRIRHFTPIAEPLLNVLPSDIGRTLAELELNVELPNILELIDDVLQNVATRQVEVSDRDGRWYTLQVRPYCTVDGSVDGAVLVLLDVTELKQSQDRALQSERLAAIGQTIATIAHESRNILQHLQSGCDLLQELLQGQPEAEQVLRGMYDQQLNLQRVFEDVQRFSAPIHLHQQVIPLSQVWHETLKDLAPLCKQRDVRIDPWPSENDPPCQIDVFRMQQVFRNILENSLAACSDPVQIQLTCWLGVLGDRPALGMRICDNGPGLTGIQRAKIFDAFYTTKRQGTGLGMAICKRFIEAHEGIIEVGTSDGGTAIQITLPLPAEKG